MTIVATPGDPVRASATSWHQALRTAIRDGVELARRLDLPPEYGRAAAGGSRQFPVFAPLGYIARMKPGDPHDPLLRQVLPLAEEEKKDEGFSVDPVGDQAATLTNGLLQKYDGRALMITTGACAVHCRYCFRRHFPYQKMPHSLAQWQETLDHLARDESLEEVILSGGDPLMLPDVQIAAIVEQLAEIPHVLRLRIHSRMPIIIPERVTNALTSYLQKTRLTTLMVVHANHPAEIDDTVCHALARMIDVGLPVLNQAVLLRGVNDDVQTLAELCRRLVNSRVLPYYLHQLDRVQGAAHFEVPSEEGLQIVNELRRLLPGYAVPRYVRELPNVPHKVEIVRA